MTAVFCWILIWCFATVVSAGWCAFQWRVWKEIIITSVLRVWLCWHSLSQSMKGCIHFWTFAVSCVRACFVAGKSKAPHSIFIYDVCVFCLSFYTPSPSSLLFSFLFLTWEGMGREEKMGLFSLWISLGSTTWTGFAHSFESLEKFRNWSASVP